MSLPSRAQTYAGPKPQAGFSLLELLVALAILLVVGGIVMAGLVQTSYVEATVANRTNMHSSVRSATELLQQEVGQAGSVTLPAPVTLQGAVTGGGSLQTVTLSSTASMFKGEELIIDTGANEETVAVAAVTHSPDQIQAYFYDAHTSGAPVRVSGAFASGVVPTTATNGSSSTVLKLYGDINDDGNMVYVVYTCSPSSSGGTLTRSMTDIPQDGSDPSTLGTAEVLLNNVTPNPSGASCFTYQNSTQGGYTFVTNVAITLTTRTQNKDLQTTQYQYETQALLNVSPRNVFEGWQLAYSSVANRVQPMPGNVADMTKMTPPSP